MLVLSPEAAGLAALMLVVALGYVLGRLKIAGLSLGPAGGTLFAALALGMAGLAPAAETAARGPTLGALGFALFMHSVGFDAGPHLFASLRERRLWHFMAVGGAVNAIALLAALAWSRLTGLSASVTAGLLAGALTSAPAYAAASETAPDAAGLAAAFALTYPIGLVGIVLAVQVVPKINRQDLSAGTAHEPEDAGPGGAVPQRGSLETTRTFVVERPEVTGLPLRDLSLTRRTGCLIALVHRGDDILVPSAETVLAAGDQVVARGRVDELRSFQELVGPERAGPDLLSRRVPTRRILVRAREVSGRTLSELHVADRYRCLVTRVERGRLWLEPDADTTVVAGDVLEVVGRREDVRELAAAFGRFEPPVGQTDVAVFAGGVLLGLLVGSVELPVGGAHVRLGMAGGLLLVGLVLGTRERWGPLRTHVPRSARQLLRDLGILLFVGETGLRVSGQVAGAATEAPWAVLGGAVLLNAAVIGGGLTLARRAFGLRPVDAWGSVAGGLTSSAALHAVRQASDSNEAGISHAAAYAVASVLATLAGPIVIALLAG